MDVTALIVMISNSQTSFENHCRTSSPLYESERCETKKKFTGSYTEVHNFSVMYCIQTNF